MKKYFFLALTTLSVLLLSNCGFLKNKPVANCDPPILELLSTPIESNAPQEIKYTWKANSEFQCLSIKLYLNEILLKEAPLQAKANEYTFNIDKLQRRDQLRALIAGSCNQEQIEAEHFYTVEEEEICAPPTDLNIELNSLQNGTYEAVGTWEGDPSFDSFYTYRLLLNGNIIITDTISARTYNTVNIPLGNLAQETNKLEFYVKATCKNGLESDEVYDYCYIIIITDDVVFTETKRMDFICGTNTQECVRLHREKITHPRPTTNCICESYSNERRTITEEEARSCFGD